MNKKLAEAMSYINEKYIAQAASRKKRRYQPLVLAAAAVLAVVILFNVPSLPLALSARAVSVASESRKMERPNIRSDKFDLWLEERERREKAIEQVVPTVAEFAGKGSREFLQGDQNALWSPVNAYIALGMTAELTGGHTRQSVLELLGMEDTQQLRQGISAIWEELYLKEGKEISILANSLWLDDQVDFHQDVMDELSYHYYADVYQRDLQGKRTGKAVSRWISAQTGGILDSGGSGAMMENTMMALVSTIYFRSQWSSKFQKINNTQGIFHGIRGDLECTYMNKKEAQMNYYWAEDYGAVQLVLKNDCRMWFILPDPDKSIQDVLEAGDYMAMLSRSDAFPEGNHKWMKVNLSVPKFDVAAETDLRKGLENLGVGDLFQLYGNDFSPSVDSELPVYLENITQNTRVTIEEEGVTAASYIKLRFGAGAAQPPEEIIDFVLDRPFVFAITHDTIPMFVGTVQMP